MKKYILWYNNNGCKEYLTSFNKLGDAINHLKDLLPIVDKKNMYINLISDIYSFKRYTI